MLKTHQDSQGGFPAPEPLENQGLQEPKIDLTDKRRELAFEQLNDVTWKLTDGVGTNQWDGYRGGYRTTRAVAWLMGIGRQLWVVRYRDKASKPMRLNAAKKYALEMVRGIRPGVACDDHIKRLNSLAAAVGGSAGKWLPPVEPSLIEYIRCVEVGPSDGAQHDVGDRDDGVEGALGHHDRKRRFFFRSVVMGGLPAIGVIEPQRQQAAIESRDRPNEIS